MIGLLAVDESVYYLRNESRLTNKKVVLKNGSSLIATYTYHLSSFNGVGFLLIELLKLAYLSFSRYSVKWVGLIWVVVLGLGRIIEKFLR